MLALHIHQLVTFPHNLSLVFIAAPLMQLDLLSQEQSFDQKFESSNKALLLSCQKGLPVRVVRSHKVRNLSACAAKQLATRHAATRRPCLHGVCPMSQLYCLYSAVAQHACPSCTAQGSLV